MIFLTEQMITRIHEDQIARYGGEPGLRDRGLLLSALAMPQQTFGGEFLHASVFEMAAAYLYHLVNNHAFMDGNKRVGLASAYVFLDLNGYMLEAVNEEIEALVLRAAQGQADKQEMAAFLKAYCQHK